jgi:predicted permease
VAAIAVISLGIGIGANATVFSVIDAVNVRPLPYRDAHRILVVRGASLREGVSRSPLSFGEIERLAARTTSLRAVSAVREEEMNLLLGDRSVPVSVARVSPNAFQAFGVVPIIGRGLGAEQDVVVTESLWWRVFGEGERTMGRALTLDGRTYSVSGIVPGATRFPDRAEAWILAVPSRGANEVRAWSAYARLAPAASVERAAAELRMVSGAVAAPASPDDWHLEATLLEDERGEDARPALYSLLALVGLLLLIACANLATLMLARSVARRREMAVRLALGATPTQIARRAVAECVVLAIAGGLLGVVLARLGVSLVEVFFPSGSRPSWLVFAVDWRVIAFDLALSVVAGIGVGLLPARALARVPMVEAIGDGGSTATPSRRKGRAMRTLVVAELALTIVLLAASAAAGRAVVDLHRADIGYEPDGLVTATIEARGASLASVGSRRAFHARVLDAVTATPGVREAAAFEPLGARDVESGANTPLPIVAYAITPGYVRTLRANLVAGRELESTDHSAVMVNQEAARRLWPDHQPLGQRLRFVDSTRGEWMRVVGVVGNVRRNPADPEIEPHIYVALDREAPFRIRLLARGEGLVRVLERVVSDVDPTQLARDVMPMETQIGEWIAPTRFFSTFVGCFAFVALILAASGVYGVTALLATERRREVAIRLALGATRRNVIREVMRNGVRLATVGTVVGACGGLAATGVLRALPLGVTGSGVVSVILAAVVLVAAAAVATYIPARRATTSEPMTVLRSS